MTGLACRTGHPNALDRIDVVKADPTDNRIIECAQAANAYIVTGDNHLLRLKRVGSITILKAADFLRLLEGQPSR